MHMAFYPSSQPEFKYRFFWLSGKRTLSFLRDLFQSQLLFYLTEGSSGSSWLWLRLWKRWLVQKGELDYSSVEFLGTYV